MSAATSTKQLESFIKAVLKAYTPAEPYEPMLPIREFIFTFLLWNTTSTKANIAYKKFMGAYVDENEFRVTQADDLKELLGVQYPNLDERIERMQASLNDAYNREHEVSIASCLELSKRDGRKYLDTLEGIAPYMSARITLICLGGHAVPIDDRMLESLIEAEIFEINATVSDAISTMERAVRASDGPAVYAAMQAWADDGAPLITKKPSKKSSGKSAKNKSGKKTSKA